MRSFSSSLISWSLTAAERVPKLVRLPLATETAPLDDAAPLRADVRELPLVGLSILVVEDSQDAREALQVRLHSLGAQVAVAADGREALDLMERGAGLDLVLCDLLMPGMDGFEFMRELGQRRALNRPPVIAVSGVATEASRDRARQVGFDGHLKKPFDQATLVAAVDAALARRRKRQASAPAP